MRFTRGALFGLMATATLVSACGGLPFIGRGEPKPVAVSGPTIGVNAFLWRVIVYDWYINPQTPNERFKTTVYILDSRLRADALNVSISKEVKDAAGAWTGAAVNPQTEIDLENAILTRARQLNLSTRR